MTIAVDGPQSVTRRDELLQRHRCTPSERLVAVAYEMFDGDGTIITIARFNVRLDAERCRKALARVQARHAKLRAGISLDDAGWPEMVFPATVGEIPCEERIVDNQNAWKQIALTERPGKVPAGTAPLVRLLLLQCQDSGTSDLFGWYHHALFDGASVAIFLQDFRAAYGAPETPLPVAPDGLSPPPKRPPGTWGDWWFLIKVFLVRAMARQRVPPPGEPPQASVIQQTWPSDLTARFLNRCFEECVTANSAVIQVALQALVETYHWGGARVVLSTPVDVRKWLHVPADALGLFITGVRTACRLPSKHTAFWDDCRRLQNQRRDEWKSKDPVRALHVIGLLGAVPIQRLVPRHPKSALFVSVIVPPPWAQSPDLPQIVDVFGMAVSNHVHGAAIQIYGQVLDGRLSLVLMSTWLDEATLNQFYRQFDEALRASLGDVGPGREPTVSESKNLGE